MIRFGRKDTTRPPTSSGELYSSRKLLVLKSISNPRSWLKRKYLLSSKRNGIKNDWQACSSVSTANAGIEVTSASLSVDDIQVLSHISSVAMDVGNKCRSDSSIDTHTISLPGWDRWERLKRFFGLKTSQDELRLVNDINVEKRSLKKNIKRFFLGKNEGHVQNSCKYSEVVGSGEHQVSYLEDEVTFDIVQPFKEIFEIEIDSVEKFKEIEIVPGGSQQGGNTYENNCFHLKNFGQWGAEMGSRKQDLRKYCENEGKNVNKSLKVVSNKLLEEGNQQGTTFENNDSHDPSFVYANHYLVDSLWRPDSA